MRDICHLKLDIISVLTHNMQIPKLSLSSDGINLTHVTALVFFLDVADMQEPRPMLVVGDTNARVSRDDVIVHGQNGGLLEMHPGHLEKNHNIKFKIRAKSEVWRAEYVAIVDFRLNTSA